MDHEFEGKKLPNGFTIPNTVTTIGISAFKNATLPTDFTIPGSVTTIGNSAFEGATLPIGFKIPNFDNRGINTFKSAIFSDGTPVSSS